MDSQLRLHPENLALFVEPAFKRHTIGYYSINSERKYLTDDSEKASLVALKEVEKSSQGIIEYEVPAHIEQLDLAEGYETYNDDYDEPEHTDLLNWLKAHPKECLDVDIVCSQKTISKIFRAPYVEATATPWEIKVTRGPDGICYLDEDEDWRVRYDELNSYAKQKYFRQRSLQKYMTIKKGVRSKCIPPPDHSNAFYRVNKLELDAGVIIYQSEIQCFDINYNAIELKAQREGQFDLPSPATRLSWWSDSYLAGTNTVLCGYYDNDDKEGGTLQRLVSFDIKHIKPRIIRDTGFDDEICIGSLCTFIQFIKDITVDGSIESFILRFEPGSKRMCILDLSASKSKSGVPSFEAQISATDETSSVEATPRTPREDDGEIIPTKISGSTGGTLPRLRTINRQDSSTVRPGMRRRNTLTTEQGGEMREELLQEVDNDDDKYGTKRKSRNRKLGNEPDVNMFHVGILFFVIVFAFVGIPWMIDWFGHPSPW